MPGLDPDLPDTDYTSVETIAEETEEWLIERGHTWLKCLYGCSMGGGVATRIIANARVGCETVVIDGGMTPYQLPRPLTWIIGVRDWCVMELGKHCSIRVLRGMFSPEKYSDEDMLYIKKVLNGMSSRTIWRAFYSCNNYSMPHPVPQPGCRMQYWYGAEEKKQRKLDIAYMKKTFPDIELVENPGIGHGEFFTLHPEEFCTQLMALLRGVS